jgi:5-methylcytosine-specific restriction endonuclease McrA
MRYYESKGFNAYYFANIIVNVVSSPISHLRSIEDLLGDLQAQHLLKPFKKFTNLHHFIYGVIEAVLTEDLYDYDSELSFLREFCVAHDVSWRFTGVIDEEDVLQTLNEDEQYTKALESITDEIFHILFLDVSFLYEFNRLCSSYIKEAYIDELHTKYVGGTGKPVRQSPPKWVQTAIFHRDKGECRECKKSLTKIINQLEAENYDHLVPLAEYGCNDISNFQLLCSSCNQKKSKKLNQPSKLYQRAFKL